MNIESTNTNPLFTPSQLRQLALLLTCLAGLVLWRLWYDASQNEPPSSAGIPAGEKWAYDERAHKLIVENTSLAYNDLDKGFAGGVGRSLSKVTRHGDGKPVLVNL